MRMVEIPCLVADVIRQHPDLKCYSSLTNYFEGSPEFTSPGLPAVTSTVWAIETKNGLVRVLENYMDAKGCRHWALEPVAGDEDYYSMEEDK